MADKIEPMDVLFLDIETTYSVEPEVLARIEATVKPPGSMSKPETIAKWSEESRPFAVQNAIRQTALNGGYGSIVAAGLSRRLDGDIVALTGSEENILRGIMHLPTDYGAIPKIVGHNIINFDLRFIRQRCIVLGIPVAGWFPENPKPWDPLVCDTMIAWCGHREYISLNELAFILGIHRVPTIDGSEVPAAYHQGRMQEIVDHCVDDIACVREIYKKMVAAGLP